MILEMAEEIIKKLLEVWNGYRSEIIIGLVTTFIATCIARIYKEIKNAPKNLYELLNNADYNSKDWREDLAKSLGIKETMSEHFPEYKDYLLIQYGSSVSPDSRLHSDYDFIVLMLGFPENGNRYMHNKGTTGEEANERNKNQIDIVYRDYLSFLFAASAGMPYENSVITDGKLIIGQEGYYQWILNITKNILFDRDFLIRRFNDKIAIEKQEFLKCVNEHETYKHDKYYVIRSGYYYITSLLQLKRLKEFDKVIVQNQITELAKVRNFYEDIHSTEIREKYKQLVENLKRNMDVDSISIDDIKLILKYLEE